MLSEVHLLLPAFQEDLSNALMECLGNNSQTKNS